MPGIGATPESEAMLMMWPCPWRAIWFAATRVPWMTPLRLMSTCRSTVSAVDSRIHSDCM